MKKRREIRNFVAGMITMALVFTLVIPVGATLVSKTIQVFTGVDIYVDGILMEPKDVNGKSVETFVYNGTTYVPIRAVSQSLGKNVYYEGSTQTVYIGETPGVNQYLLEVCPPYQTQNYNGWYRCKTYYGSKTESFLMAGQKYTNGLTLAGCNSNSTYAMFNLNGQYKSLHMTIAPVDGAKNPSSIAFIVDGVSVYEHTVNPGDYPCEITVPLNYGLQLKISTVDGGGNDDTGLGNIIVE